MGIAWIYARVSPTIKKKGVALNSNGEEMNLSIEKQIEYCTNSAKAEGYEIKKVFYDEYVSGKANEYMAQFNQMVQEAENASDVERPHRIYCMRITRFGRNVLEMLQAEKKMRDKSITLKFVQEGIDTSTTIGRLIMGILAGFAEWQLEEMRTNLAIGRERALARGQKFGRKGKPFDESLAREMREKGMSFRRIAKALGVSTGVIFNKLKAVK